MSKLGDKLHELLERDLTRYDEGVLGDDHEDFINEVTAQFKDLILELIGDDWPTAGYSHAVDREDKKAWLVNDVLAKIRQKVEEL